MKSKVAHAAFFYFIRFADGEELLPSAPMHGATIGFLKKITFRLAKGT